MPMQAVEIQIVGLGGPIEGVESDSNRSNWECLHFELNTDCAVGSHQP